MKGRRFGSPISLSLVASFLVMGMQPPLFPSTRSSPPSFASASATNTTCTNADANCLATYQPMQAKGGLGRVLSWGLAKIEGLYDGGVDVSDLISAFLATCDRMIALMIHSFKDMASSYEELHEKEVENLKQFDNEFRDLAALRNKIDRKCLYSNMSAEHRSLYCVEKGMDIREKIRQLRDQRAKSAGAVERYRGMIDWCAGYNNWFC